MIDAEGTDALHNGAVRKANVLDAVCAGTARNHDCVRHRPDS